MCLIGKFALAGSLIALSGGYLANLDLRYNLSDSAPQGLWRALPGVPAIHDWVFGCIDIQAARLAKQRGYLSAGDCPGAVLSVLKRVVAAPDDHVRTTAEGAWINGRRLPHSRPSLVDSASRSMQFAQHNALLGPGSYWLQGKGFKSYDSRYFGLVHEPIKAQLLFCFGFRCDG